MPIFKNSIHFLFIGLGNSMVTFAWKGWFCYIGPKAHSSPCPISDDGQ